MTEAHKIHTVMVSVLREKKFDRLVVKRFEGKCYLTIIIEGKTYVFADHAGLKKEYRHVWQITDWLESAFNIRAEKVSVETINA